MTNPATPTSNVIPGITKLAADELLAPFDVDGGSGTLVVTVSV